MNAFVSVYGINFFFFFFRCTYPNKQWEKIKLSRNFQKAISQMNEHMLYWPGPLKSMCKQRFVRITQYLIRMRKLKLKTQYVLFNLMILNV